MECTGVRVCALAQVDTGLVQYHFVREVPPMRRPQLYIYDTCLQKLRHGHTWMSFTDMDEFFVLRNASIPDMPALLREYEEFGGLAVNWQVCLLSSRWCSLAGASLVLAAIPCACYGKCTL